MRLLLCLAVFSLAACADPAPETEPDVTGTVEAGGASTDGTLDSDPVDPTTGGLDADAPDADPALAVPDDSVHAGI